MSPMHRVANIQVDLEASKEKVLIDGLMNESQKITDWNVHVKKDLIIT
jgi:hypothetical protein